MRISVPTATSEFDAETGNVSAEAEAAYNFLMTAFIDADFAAQRVVLAYDASLAHLQECRFESSAAHEILAASNRMARTFASSVPSEQNARRQPSDVTAERT